MLRFVVPVEVVENADVHALEQNVHADVIDSVHVEKRHGM
jgi:hypothetical protein